MRDKRDRLQTGGTLGKMGKEPRLDQAAHMANSRGQRGLKESEMEEGLGDWLARPLTSQRLRATQQLVQGHKTNE